MKFKYHQDNGHGWLEVPVELLRELGIETEITGCSYMDRKRGIAYLEEDLDAGTFCNKYLVPGEKLITVSVMSERSFIRRLPQYKAEKIVVNLPKPKENYQSQEKPIQISLF